MAGTEVPDVAEGPTWALRQGKEEYGLDIDTH